MTMTTPDDPNPPASHEPRPPVPDPARPALPPITRVNSRILYAAAIFGLIAIWVVTFTVTSRKPQARPQPPPPVQEAQPNLDALAGLAERVRVAQEMQKKLAAAERPGPFDPFRGSLEAPEPAAENLSPSPSSLDREAAAASQAPPAGPPRYTLEPPRPPEPAPGRSRLEEALASPPLIAPASRASRTRDAEGAVSDPTDRLVDLLARHMPSVSDPPGQALKPLDTVAPAGSASGPTSALARLVRPQTPLSPFVLYEGTILPAVLTSELTSDLPGIATATLRDPVYDSPSGRHLILPPGTRALGKYDADLAQGDSRLLVAWHRLILPDGRFFEIPASAAADVHGATGLTDRTNRHLGRAVTSTLLLSILGAGAQLSQPTSAASLNGYRPPTAGEVAAGAFGQQLNHLSTDLLERDLRVKPTLTIRPGTAFGIVLQADLAFAAPYPENPEGLP